jgi:hypothetical protein
MKRSPIRRHPHKDPVTPELRQAVLERDRGCVARRLDSLAGYCSGTLTLDHVKEEPRLGVRAPSDPAHLVTLCQGHSEVGMKSGHQWNTANRPLLRSYLAIVSPLMEAAT